MKIGRTAGVIVACAAVLVSGCNFQELAQRRGAPRRLSIATGGTGGVYYAYGGGLAKIIGEAIPNVEATAEVTAASVDNLKFLRDGKSDIAFTLADTLDDAVNGKGAFKDVGKVPARALAALYTNYTHLVALAGSGITRIADLRGRVISTGAAGSGTEIIALRMLKAAGLSPGTDVRTQNLSAAQSVDAIKDRKIQAFFWSGGIPTAAVLDLANTPGMRMIIIPNEDVLPALQQIYDSALYYRMVVPKGAYPGLDADVPVVGVTNLLVVSDRMSDDLAYAIVKAMFDRQHELIAIHPQARELSLETAIAGSPAPFHPGAVRYYRERNVWKQ